LCIHTHRDAKREREKRKKKWKIEVNRLRPAFAENFQNVIAPCPTLAEAEHEEKEGRIV
jgi:hypothetical protein